ncbi:MAG TPA: hypothetical protein PLF92_08150 [Arenimonas sp.]|nr:hypothetical protein [Arenimonas sp.]
MKICHKLAFLFLIAASSSANAGSATKPITLDVNQTDFNTQRDKVLNAIESSENYSEITEADKASIKQSLLVLSEKLPDGGNVSTLTAEDREKVLSEQKLVNSLLAKAAKDSQIICRDEDVSGSHLPRKVCRTRAAHRLYAEQQREALNKSSNGSNQVNSKVSDTRASN